jgi:hypothetical protein
MKKIMQKNGTYQSTGGVESTTVYNCVYNRRDENKSCKHCCLRKSSLSER